MTKTDITATLPERCTFPVRHDGHPGPNWNPPLSLDAGLTQAIAEFCRHHAVNETCFYYTLWSVVLFQFSDADRVLFGSPQMAEDSVAWMDYPMVVTAPLVDEQAPAHKMLDSHTWVTYPPGSCSSGAFNTGIVCLHPGDVGQPHDMFMLKNKSQGRDGETKVIQASPQMLSLQ